MNTTSPRYAVIVENLTVAYDTKPILWDINLTIPKGTLMAVVGPNGAGKTTLLKSMLGFMKPISGNVRFIGQNKHAPCPQHRIGYVPQSGSVDWDFPATAQDVVLMGCYGKLGWFRRPGKSEIALARQALHKVGMAAYASQQIGQLSGGQQQRVFIARALMQEADVYFLDEPFKGVDAQTEKVIVLLLKALKEEGKTVVVVHHDLQTVTDYFDWVTLINLRIVASGPVEDVFHEENLKKTYRNISTLVRSME